MVVWGTLAAISFLGAVGNILLKIGTNKLGVIPPQRFLDIHFILEYLLTPSILAALVFLFLGRFLIGSPMSVLGVTQTYIAITILGLIFSLILEKIFFQPKYDMWTYLGVIAGLLSIVLIGRTTTS